MAKAKATYLYSCKVGSTPNTFTISKLSEDLEVLGSYTLTESGSGALHCDCPAHKPWCRHCAMLRLFQAEERVGLGWFYRFETEEWVPPLDVQS